jgi:opacity protein-like surface antigen
MTIKKHTITALAILFAPNLAWAGGFRVALKGSYFSAEDSIFRDVYGSAAKFGLEAGLDLAPNLSLWASVDTVHKTGKLTVSEEETRVWITPIGAGLRYDIPADDKFLFHVKAGLEDVFFKEENVIGTASESALGFIAGAGGAYRVADAISLGVFASWSTCKMSHNGVDFKSGGVDLGGAIEIRF